MCWHVLLHFVSFYLANYNEWVDQLTQCTELYGLWRNLYAVTHGLYSFSCWYLESHVGLRIVTCSLSRSKDSSWIRLLILPVWLELRYFGSFTGCQFANGSSTSWQSSPTKTQSTDTRAFTLIYNYQPRMHVHYDRQTSVSFYRGWL